MFFFFSFYILASETRVRAIIHAFLLLFLFSGPGTVFWISLLCFFFFFFFFFFFWLRKHVYEQSYTRFLCFFYFFFSSEHVYNCLYTCFLGLFFLFLIFFFCFRGSF